MQTKIEVKDRKEAEQLRVGLSDPAVRAFVCVMGVLGTLKSQQTKERVITFVKDHFEEMGVAFAAEMVKLSRQQGLTILGEFNQYTLEARPGMTVDEVLKPWNDDQRESYLNR